MSKTDQHSSARTLVLIETGGRFGNHLMNFAYWVGRARQEGWTVWNYGIGRYRKHFEAWQNQRVPVWPVDGRGPAALQHVLLRSLLRISEQIDQRTQLRMDEQAQRLPRLFRPAGWGYLAFDWRQPCRFRPALLAPTHGGVTGDRVAQYLQQHRAVLIDSHIMNPRPARLVDKASRDFFRFQPKEVQPAKAFVADLRRDYDFILGIHIRQGDFRTWAGGANYFDPSCHARAAAHYLKHHPARRPVCVVLSDEPVPAPVFAGLPTRQGMGDFMGDLATLMECDRIIATCSSFSGWASYAANVPLYNLQREVEGPTEADFGVWCAD